MSGMFRPSWTPASLQNLNKNFAFFSDELVVVPPPPLTSAYLRDRAPIQLPLAKALPPAPAASTLPPRPILCQMPFGDVRQTQLRQVSMLPPSQAESVNPLPAPLARVQVDATWQRGWSLVQSNIAALAAGSSQGGVGPFTSNQFAIRREFSFKL